MSLARAAAMDLEAQMQTWFPALEPGVEVMPGVWFLGTSVELGPQLLFRTATGPVCVEVLPRAHATRFAVANDAFALSYRAGASDAKVEPAVGKQLCTLLLGLLPQDRPESAPAPADARRVRDVHVARALHWRELGDQSHYTITPYVGCTVGCRFCYAQSRLQPARALCGLPQLAWGDYVDARINLADVLREELRSAKPGPVKFSPIVSDPYQPLERHRRVTRSCLDAFAEIDRGFTVMVLTRTRGILEDLPRLAALPRTVVGVSLPSADPEVLAHFEPRAASLAERIEVLDAASAAGVETMAVVQPMLPGSVDTLAELLAPRVSSVSAGALEGTFAAGTLFDAPIYRGCAAPKWQSAQLEAFRTALKSRSVPTWGGELPPHLRSPGPRP